MASTDPNRARLLRELVSDPDPKAAKFGREQLKAELEHQHRIERRLLVTEQVILAAVGLFALLIMGGSLALGLQNEAPIAALLALASELIALCSALAARSYWGAKQPSQVALRAEPSQPQLEA